MRSCGSCSLCCKIMGVPGVKERHQWCPHASPGKGCRIYDSRPEPCRQFSCQWLLDETLGNDWFPAHAKIVIDLQRNNGPHGFDNPDGPLVLCFIVDPHYPLRWREEPWFSEIKRLAVAGQQGYKNARWSTVVMVGDEKIPVME